MANPDLEERVETQNRKFHRWLLVAVALALALLVAVAVIGTLTMSTTSATVRELRHNGVVISERQQDLKKLLDFVAEAQDPNSTVAKQSQVNTARFVLAAVNEVRADNGLPPLTLEQLLDVIRKEQ